jgi:hypothetical protein
MLAFGQVILFLGLLLFICVRAGMGAPSNSGFHPELKLSTYTTENERDPFGFRTARGAGTTATPVGKAVAPAALKLQGILYQASSPSAMINNQLVALNKPTVLRSEQGEITVKAVEITRESVVLELEGRKLELRLSGDERGK